MKYHKGAQLQRYMLSKILLILIMAAILNDKVNPFFHREWKRWWVLQVFLYAKEYRYMVHSNHLRHRRASALWKKKNTFSSFCRISIFCFFFAPKKSKVGISSVGVDLRPSSIYNNYSISSNREGRNFWPLTWSPVKNKLASLLFQYDA